LNIRDILNKLKWDPILKGTRKDIRIDIIYRGAPKDQISINFDDIIEIHVTSLLITPEYPDASGLIPFHRILKISNTKTGDIYFQKDQT